MKKLYQTIKIRGRLHVLKEMKRSYEANLPDPNYRNTGMALCGVVEKGKDLDHWIKKYNK